MCFGPFSYIPLLTERDRSGIWGYKHVAPPEQEPSISDHDDLSGKTCSPGPTRRYRVTVLTLSNCES